MDAPEIDIAAIKVNINPDIIFLMTSIKKCWFFKGASGANANDPS